MILPRAFYELVGDKLANADAILNYARFHVNLSEILSGDFFNHYIKSGSFHARPA